MSTESSVLLPPQGQRILVMMAHPDDAEFICGGTIARLVAEGRDVYYVLVTSGNRGSHEAGMTMERLGKMREDEQRHAAGVIGVRDVIFLGYNDGEVEVNLGLRKELVHAIRQVQPDVLFTFDPGDHMRFIQTIVMLACVRWMQLRRQGCQCIILSN